MTKSGEGEGPILDGDLIRLLNGQEMEVNSIVLPAASTEPVEWVEVQRRRCISTVAARVLESSS